MRCVNKCSFMKKEKDSNVWFCSLYNQNLIKSGNYVIACQECEDQEIEVLKNYIDSLNKIKNIIDRM